MRGINTIELRPILIAYGVRVNPCYRSQRTVKLAVAIDRVQLFDTLNLSSQRDDLLTESSIYERQNTRYVECSEGSVSYEVLLGSLG